MYECSWQKNKKILSIKDRIYLRYHLFCMQKRTPLFRVPTHPLPLTQAYGPGTACRKSVPLYKSTFLHSLSDPFAGRPAAGLSPSPTLCRRPRRFDLRFTGFIALLMDVLYYIAAALSRGILKNFYFAVIQPLRHGYAMPPPLTQGRQGSEMASLWGGLEVNGSLVGRLRSKRPPCVKGAGGKAAWGIVWLIYARLSFVLISRLHRANPPADSAR